ncbi:hypothetical protein [Hymenobacter aerophilus]|uniref:hypothetical protein n=1 Tax=Hymenobacter aerophilus TaxID=119644 RepID=UPI00036AB2BF|nr:hypothetical protein [Hymenobacter aerophilus]
MLFFYGTGSSRLLTAPLPATACTHCGITGQLSATVFSRYVSLFWTPIFPFGKMSVTVCGHCQQTIAKLKQMPESYRPPVRQLQEQARYPLTNFAALILFGLVLAGIFGLAWCSGPKEPAAYTAAEQALAGAELEVGARYQSKAGKDDGTYALVEITRLTPDTVYFKGTSILRGPLTPASATIALRDSVSAAGSRVPYPREMWAQLMEGAVGMRRIK